MADEVSVKVIFDNLRNYLICGALIVAIHAVAKNQTSASFWPVVPALVTPLIYVLLVANIFQSWLIVDELETKIIRAAKGVSSTWRRPLRWLVLIVLVLLWTPVMMAAYGVVPALAQWAITGGKMNAL